MSVLTGIRRLIKSLTFSKVVSRYGTFGNILESFAGAWQRNSPIESQDTLLKNSAVYACVTGIAGDIAKMRIKLCQNNGGIWSEITENKPWLSVLRKPNHFQTRIQFLECWIISKLAHGNAYLLKERDARGIVTALYPLDPHRVVPLVTVEGDVYYQLNQDDLCHVSEASVIVPASEIIHDRAACLFHPLVGIAPLYACAMSSTLGNRIQRHSAQFFLNRAVPGGMLTAPGTIDEITAKRLKEEFEKNYSGENIGRLVVLGDGLEYKLMQMTAENAQLAEQFKMSIEDIGRAFHYPIFKLGGPVPTLAGNVEAVITTYYTDCLQGLIESVELLLDEGLSLGSGLGTELDLDNLMRMDTKGLYEANSEAVGGGWMSPDEARFKANLNRVAGGETPYLQQQNYSLAALAKRDARADLWDKPQPAPAPKPDPDGADDSKKTLPPQEYKLFGKARLKERWAA